jgi:class 3 adenylate cyclase
MERVSDRSSRPAFGSYLDPVVLDQIVRDGELLQGAEVLVTLLVLDIRDFTHFADRSSARETVAHLNDFFGRVVPIIRKHHGHPNRFLVDGLLAVFGVPEDLDDHAERAVAAAVEISATLEESHRIGIGVNSGVVVAGTIGGGGKLDFTLIGDAVNVATRIEQLTKETGDRVLVGESTRVLLGHHPTFVFEWQGTHTLRDKSAPVDVYALAPRRSARRL